MGEHTSRVLLITDIAHSIPVQVLRNDVRMIASGTGHNDELVLDNVPRSVDIEKGDLLVTSGLGGRFLEGYPVAIVESVSRDGQNYFATVTAKPLAFIDKLRYVLLLWPTNEDTRKASPITPADVRKAVEQRLATQGNEAQKVKKALVPDVPPAEQTPSEATSDLPTETPHENPVEAVPVEDKSPREED